MAGPAWLTDPSPQAKKRRQVAMIAGGALLALMLLMRGRATTPAGTANGDLQASSSPATPGTFADNGAQAAGLGTDVTAGLGTLSTSLDNQQASFDALNASLTDALAAIPDDAGDQPVQAAPAAIAAAGKATNTSKGHAKNAAGAQVQTHGTRKGLRYTTQIEKGRVVRSYESGRGRGDFGKQRGSRVVIKKDHPAKAPKASKQTAARPKATTNPPQRSPSQPAHHAQPVHKKPHKKAHH